MNPQNNWSFSSNQMNGNHNQYNAQFNQQISNPLYGSHNQNNQGYLPGQYQMNNVNNNMNNIQNMSNISHISYNLPFSPGNNNNMNYPGQFGVFSSSCLS
jgi:hypothetical protein